MDESTDVVRTSEAAIGGRTDVVGLEETDDIGFIKLAEVQNGNMVKISEVRDKGKAGSNDAGRERRDVVQSVEELAYREGPLSIAEVISPRKMYRHLLSVSEKDESICSASGEC